MELIASRFRSGCIRLCRITNMSLRYRTFRCRWLYSPRYKGPAAAGSGTSMTSMGPARVIGTTIREIWGGRAGPDIVLRRAILMVLALASAIGLTGCFGDCGTGGQAPNPQAPADTGYIAGYVTEGRGGSPVPGGSVTAVPVQEGGVAKARAAGPTYPTGRDSVAAAAAVATVGQDGRYSLALRPGRYDVIVAKEGMGTTKAQGVMVRAGERVTVNLPQYAQPGSPAPSATPASLALAVGGVAVAPGHVVSGAAEILVSVVEENALLPVESIEIRVGHESLNPDYVGAPSSPSSSSLSPSSSSSRVLTWSWQTIDYGNGPTYIHVSAYDAGRNLTILKMPLTVANGLPVTPTGLTVIANTCGENIASARGSRGGGTHVVGRSMISRNSHGTHLMGKIGEIRGMSEGNGMRGISRSDPQRRAQAIQPAAFPEVKAAPAGGFLAVQVLFDSQPDAKGYRIYRSINGGEPWVLTGDVRPQGQGGGAGFDSPYMIEFWDADPALSVGRKAFYRVAAYNDAGEGAPTDPVYTIPLPKFNVSLVAPDDGSSDLSLAPVLAWQPVWEPYGPGEPGYASAIAAFAEAQTQVYQIEVKRAADGFSMWTATWATSAASISPAQVAPTVIPTQVVYNSDGSGRALEPGASYEWDVSAYLQVRYSANSEAFTWSAGNGLSINGPFRFSTGLL